MENDPLEMEAFDVGGDVSTPTIDIIPAPHEDALVGTEETNIYEPLRDDAEAKSYFETIPEEEALNYIMMLRSGNYISFERLNQLKDILESSTTIIP